MVRLTKKQMNKLKKEMKEEEFDLDTIVHNIFTTGCIPGATRNFRVAISVSPSQKKKLRLR